MGEFEEYLDRGKTKNSIGEINSAIKEACGENNGAVSEEITKLYMQRMMRGLWLNV